VCLGLLATYPLHLLHIPPSLLGLVLFSRVLYLVLCVVEFVPTKGFFVPPKDFLGICEEHVVGQP